MQAPDGWWRAAHALWLDQRSLSCIVLGLRLGFQLKSWTRNPSRVLLAKLLHNTLHSAAGSAVLYGRTPHGWRRACMRCTKISTSPSSIPIAAAAVRYGT
jgi:hypothetical protein